MSHISECPVKIRDLDAFAKACAALGHTFIAGQRTYKWFGKFMNDTPLPEGVSVKDIGKCDHAVKVKGASYEVGVVANSDGSYSLRYDYWGAGGLVSALGGQKGEKLVQRYGAEVARKELLRKGYRIVETMSADGSLVLTAQGR